MQSIGFGLSVINPKEGLAIDEPTNKGGEQE